MRLLTYIVALILSFPVFAVRTDNTQVEECIIEGSQIQLMGKLIAETMPADSQNSEVYWILNTNKPYCGEGYDPKTKMITRLEETCSHFQLKLSSEQYDSHRELLGKDVVVKGTIFIAKSGRQFAGMLIEVSEIELESEH